MWVRPGCWQVWERVSLKASLSPEPRGRLCAMLLVGDVLMALCDTGLLRVWDARSLSLEGEMELGGDQRLGACLIHPDTYLNKVSSDVTQMVPHG